jgi:hypothetical protein
VTFGEDAATSRTGSGPVNLATIRAAVIAALKDAGYLHILEGRRDHATPTETLRLHGLDLDRNGHSRNTPEPWCPACVGSAISGADLGDPRMLRQDSWPGKGTLQSGIITPGAASASYDRILWGRCIRRRIADCAT